MVLINPHVPPDESKNEDQTEAKVIVDEILKFNCRVSLKKGIIAVNLSIIRNFQ